MLRYKIFFWFVLHDRVNSRNLLHRKSFHLPSYNCELCHQHTEETALHLFWDCEFASECWGSILGRWKRGISIFDEITLLTEAFPPNIAMKISIMGCWNIWMQRNGKIFRSQPRAVQAWRRSLRTDLLLLKHRVKNKFEALLSNWVDQFLS
jgi:hypothetical protein